MRQNIITPAAVFGNPPGSLERDFKLFQFIGFVFRRLTETAETDVLPGGHVIAQADALGAAAAASATSLIWIGHATFLIRLGGLNILTDPYFSSAPRRFPFSARNATRRPVSD